MSKTVATFSLWYPPSLSVLPAMAQKCIWRSRSNLCFAIFPVEEEYYDLDPDEIDLDPPVALTSAPAATTAAATGETTAPVLSHKAADSMAKLKRKALKNYVDGESLVIFSLRITWRL